MGHDHVEHPAEQPRIDPEHHQPKADHANGAVKQFAIKPQPAFESDRQGKGHDQRNPDRQQTLRHAAKDARLGAHENAPDDIDHQQRRRRRDPRGGDLPQAARPRRGSGQQGPDHLHRDAKQHDQHRAPQQGVHPVQRTCPCQGVHLHCLLR